MQGQGLEAQSLSGRTGSVLASVLETSLQRGICLTVITSLKLTPTEPGSLRSVREKGFAVKINLYLLKMSS